jgi:hypothetical protein
MSDGPLHFFLSWREIRRSRCHFLVFIVAGICAALLGGFLAAIEIYEPQMEEGMLFGPILTPILMFVGTFLVIWLKYLSFRWTLIGGRADLMNLVLWKPTIRPKLKAMMRTSKSKAANAG